MGYNLLNIHSFDLSVNVNGLGLIVVLSKEWSGKAFAVCSHLVFGIGQGICQKIQGLVGGNGKFLQCRPCWIPGKDFGFFLGILVVSTGILEFSKARQQPGTVGLDLMLSSFVVHFLAETKLHAEPIAPGKLLDIFVARSETGQSNLL